MRARCRLSRTAVVASCLIAAFASLGFAANTATDGSTLAFVTCNGRAGFRMSELQQAATDATGDLDTNDLVLQVLDLGGGTIDNAGIDASGPLACGGDLFAFGVSELNYGSDLNGDLDTGDVVVHLYDAATMTLTNLGFAVTEIAASASIVAFSVSEAGQAATDLNGDLDAFDNVVHVYDTGTMVTANTGQDGSTLVADGSVVAFRTSEAAQGNTVLNTDGDAFDFILRLYDASTSTLYDAQRQAQPGLRLVGTTVAFLVSEVEEGLSLNADPDQSDLVPHLYCINSPPCVTTGLITLARAATDGGFEFSGDLVAFTSRELAQNKSDLNGDGDKKDRIAHVYEVQTGTLHNVGRDARYTPTIGANRIAFQTLERAQNKTDLNGDGDLGDRIVQVYDVSSGTVTNTQRGAGIRCKNEAVGMSSGSCIRASGDMLLMLTSERNQNRTDLNGDGDRNDLVAEFWDLATSTLTMTGLAADKKSGIVLGNTVLAFRAGERRERTDLNGDFDTRDLVMTVFDSGALSHTVLAQDADDLFLFDGDTLVYRTDEGNQGQDLNADVDFNDNIMQYQP